MLYYILQILLLILLADFFTGILHWWEDTYGNPAWPIVGKWVVLPNLRHHSKPRAFLKDGYWSRVNTSVFLAVGLGLACYFSGLLCWQIVFFLAYSSQANEIHAFAHRGPQENGPIISLLQNIGLFQQARTHGLHHTAPFDCNYCVLTEYVNPVLHKIRFWGRVEAFIALFGIFPLRESEQREFV